MRNIYQNMNKAAAVDKTAQAEEARKHRHMIEVIRTEDFRLSAWEEEFIDSIDAGLEKYGHLTPKQASVLERMYAEKTS